MSLGISKEKQIKKSMNAIHESICAIIVTYNRKNLLIECIEALRKQTRPIQGIYLIDNASTDGTPESLLERGYIKELPTKSLKEPWEREFEINNLTDGKSIKIHYVRMPENTGSSGGFYEGVKRGYEKGYDWLWLMDDDGLPDNWCLEFLLKYRKYANFIAPLVLDKEDRQYLSFSIRDYNKGKWIKKVKEIDKEIYENTASPFNGVLIASKLIEKIGYPKKEMFIWGDETEYLYRAIANGERVITVAKALFYHPKGRLKLKKILRSFSIVLLEEPFRNYCWIRNHAYIFKKYDKLALLKFIIKYTVAFIFGYISMKDFLFYIRAVKDGLLEIWGREKEFLEIKK